MILLLIVLLLLVLYAVIIFYYNNNWRTMPVFEPSHSSPLVTRFSVIVPARNETENIDALLQSVTNQHYPTNQFEVIVVDDHSTDDTAEKVKQFTDVKLIQLKDDNINSYKKKAIETGIAAAKFEWIVCTDADCVATPQWLFTYASFIQQYEPVFIAAPVSLQASGNKSILAVFQILDFLTLQGITAASVYKNIHSMCNGANLAYRKDAFYNVDGFMGIDNIASGDDMLLMHKIWKKYPGKVAYLKSKRSIIQTGVSTSWKAFFSQRIRWASKATGYDDKRIFAVLLLVYLFNVSFLVLLGASFFNIYYLYSLFAFWILKTLVELPFVFSVSKFFNRQNFIKYFFFFQPLHIAYTITAGFLGSFGKYEWKGRRVK